MTAPDNHDELCKRLEAGCVTGVSPFHVLQPETGDLLAEAAAAIRVLVGERDEMCDLAFTTDPENGQSVAWEEVAATQRARANAHLAARQAAEAALAVAVEALVVVKSRVQTWPLGDQETCMCGVVMEGHDPIAAGHSPVSMGDYAVTSIVAEIDQALASMKEKAGG